MSKESLLNTDVESGGRPLHPMMLEPPELRWAFIRKVYAIIAVQLLATAAVAATVVLVHPVTTFFLGSVAGLLVYIAVVIAVLVVLFPLYIYKDHHPMNYILLGIFTILLSLSVGLTCAFTSGKIILEAAILTSVIVISLTLYTFWAARRGHDFNFLGPFLFAALSGLIAFGLIQIFFPYNKISVMIYEGVSILVFCGYIIYDTDNLIKRFSYDEYIWAAVSLYLDIINIFVSLVSLLRAADS